MTFHTSFICLFRSDFFDDSHHFFMTLFFMSLRTHTDFFYLSSFAGGVKGGKMVMVIYMCPQTLIPLEFTAGRVRLGMVGGKSLALSSAPLCFSIFLLDVDTLSKGRKTWFL